MTRRKGNSHAPCLPSIVSRKRHGKTCFDFPFLITQDDVSAVRPSPDDVHTEGAQQQSRRAAAEM